MTLRALRTSAVVAGVLLLASPPAHAQGQPALADDLFRSARQLLEQGKVAEACSRFAESQRLDPKPGTLLNLGLCHEREGRNATAYAEVTEATQQLARLGDKEREALARTRLEAIAPNVAKVAIVLPPDSPVDRLMIDDHEVGRAAWSIPIPLDPGPHKVTASASGRRSSTQSIDVGRTGGVVRLELAPLELEAAPVAPPAPSRGTEEPVATSSGKRTASLVVLGTGAVALGLGTFFGLRAVSAKSDVDAGCPSTKGCNDAGLDAVDSGRTSATISTVAFGVGLVAVGVGIYLFATSGSSRGAPARAMSVPTFTF